MLALCNPLPVADSGLLTNGDDRARSEIGNRVSVLPLHAETASGTLFPPVGLPQLGNNVEKDASGSEQFVTAPSRPRRVLRRGAIVVAAGAGAWLIGSLLMIFGSGIQVVQSTGGGTAATGGSFTLGGAYVLPFTVFGIASILVGAGYLVYSSGLTWPDSRSRSPIGFRRSRPQAVLVAILFFAYGAVAIAMIPFLSTTQGLIAWLIASIILVLAAGRHFRFLKDLRTESGLTEKLGGRGLRSFSRVGLVGVLALAAPILLNASATVPGIAFLTGLVALAGPSLVVVARLLEFFILPLLGVVVFGLMIPRAMRLTGVGTPPVVRATMPVGAPSSPVRPIQQTQAAISPIMFGAAGAPPENPPVPLPAVVATPAPGEPSWVVNLQTEIANLEEALAAQKDSLSQLNVEFQGGRIERSRLDELERTGSDRIAVLEKNLAERRQQLAKGPPEMP